MEPSTGVAEADLRPWPPAEADLRPWPPTRHCGGLRGDNLSPRGRGYAYGLFAILVVSPDALLLRLCDGEDPIFVALCRCLWVACFSAATVCSLEGGIRRVASLTYEHRKPLAGVSLICCGTAMGFAFSLQLTGSAEALLLISINPLWAALIGWRFLGDALPLRTLLALAGATASILIMYLPRVLGWGDDTSHDTSDAEEGEHSDRPYRLMGDLIALGTGLCLAAFGNAVRHVRLHYSPDVPLMVAQVGSNSIAAVVNLCLLGALSRPLSAARPGRLVGLTCLMGLILNLAYLGFNRAPQYLAAAEFGVICLIETVLGPVWVFLGVGEAPSTWTLLGGPLLLLILAAHEVAAHVAARRAPTTVTKPTTDTGAADGGANGIPMAHA